MAKTHINLSIESEVYREFVEVVNKGNVSGYVENYMQNTIATQRKDTNKINIRILNIEIEQLHKKVSKLNSELQNKVSLKEKYDLIQKDKEKTTLEKEQKKIELSQQCINCNKILDKLKVHKFPNGNVCNTCYMGSDNEMLKKWGFSL